jgi:hypothetical protein
MSKSVIFCAVFVMLLWAGPCFAQESTDQNTTATQGQWSGEGHAHHAPPQAAIDACASHSEGDDCEFTTPKGTDVSGTCSQIRDGQTLFCKRARKTSS